MNFNIQNTFTNKLPADVSFENTPRQVHNACFSYVTPKKTSNPKVIHVSKEMANSLGISREETQSELFKNLVTGNTILPNTKPYAMCYGGHQFGNWAGQLGDGRAINLFETLHHGKPWSLQLKGAGATPYSRTADGLAVLRSSIREYLCSEAMHHLGIPTTRALSLCLSGDQVLRDILYNGNPALEKGAIVCRTAPSFIRFGNFEILAARNDHKTLKELTDYTINHFYPKIVSKGIQKYLDFFKEVCHNTIHMIINWQRVGFVHGVMNTDNMSILGLTIDYGPYGWLEGYDYNWTPNTTDSQHKRYRYGNQQYIGLWNLYKLANALYPLIEETAPLQEILEECNVLFSEQYLTMMLHKIGLFSSDKNNAKLIDKLEENLHLSETDMTIFFRNLALISTKDTEQSALKKVENSFYFINEIKGKIKDSWLVWFKQYLTELQKETISEMNKKQKMNAINPKYVLRNYMAQLAIEKADIGDYSLIETFYQLLKNPYAEQIENKKWFAKKPEWARHKVGCSMLSCSS